MKDLLKYFTLVQVVAIINQIKTAPTYIYDKFFAKTPVGSLSPNIEIPIYKGSGVVLESVSEEGKHLVSDQGDKYMLTLTIPRFPLEKTIPASELNQILALDGKKEQVESLAQRLGQIAQGHKSSFMTTLEFMAAGALFGKVTDGKGKTLVEFKKSGNNPLVLDANTIIIAHLNAIDDALEAELGHVPAYEILASRTYINGLAERAKAEDLFKGGQAEWIEKDGRRILSVHGTSFVPYSASYKNTRGQTKKFLADNTAIVTPLTSDVYKTYYARANHTDAQKLPPKLFFMAPPEKLTKGAGYSVVSEMRAIPICVRPGALIPLTYQAA